MVLIELLSTFAIMQETMFVSSLPVTATTISAFAISALTKTFGYEQLPKMVLRSASSSKRFKGIDLLSTITISFSSDSNVARVLPTAPAPRITIFTSFFSSRS